MRATESVQSETARNFSRLFNESGYISGHATLNEVSRYTKAADQKRMAVDAMGTISRTKLPTRSTKG